MLHDARLSRSQWVAKMIKLRCKVPNIEAAELASAKWRCRIRACANRSWLSGGSALPTVTNPAFPDKPSHHDDHVGEGDPEVYDPTLPLGTPHKLLMGVVPRVRPLHDPAQAGCERSGRAFFGDHAHEPTLLQKSAGLSRVVGPI